VAALALLHVTAQIEWVKWSVHPSTVVGIAAAAALYEWRARRTADDDTRAQSRQPSAVSSELVASRRAPAGPRRSQRISFFAGLALLFASLNGPLHDLSDAYLFSAHMVQHLVLTLVVPPLLIVGIPGAMLRPALASPRVAALARWITKPARCFVIFNLVVAAWHLPPLYNTALAIHPVHIGQHLMFLVAAVLMWWPFLSPLPELPRLAYPGQMLYCFLMSIPMSIVAIYIAMADHVLYPAYASAPRIWGISPMTDQHIGGLIMWIPGALFFYVVMTVVFFKWAQRDTDDTAGAQVRERTA
jgi:putative membrane protein